MKAPALVLAIPKGGDSKGSPSSSDAGPSDDEAAERDAFEEFADAIGIPDDKRDDAFDAFSAAVKACMAREGAGDYGEEGA